MPSPHTGPPLVVDEVEVVSSVVPVVPVLVVAAVVEVPAVVVVCEPVLLEVSVSEPVVSVAVPTVSPVQPARLKRAARVARRREFWVMVPGAIG